MITVLGASGFVGSHLVKELIKKNIEHYAPQRDESLKERFLGDIIYCIGLTGDAKYKPHETVIAHVTKLQDIISNSRFSSITYCSSTRIYINNEFTEETASVKIDVSDPFELFNLTKLTAESLLQNTVKNYKIVRLSNVFGDDFGSDNFITSIVKDALSNNKVTLRTTPESAKDYVSITDLVSMLINIAQQAEVKGIYNVAYGKNITNKQILNKLNELTGAEIEYVTTAATIVFPEIKIDKIVKEFDFAPTSSIIDFLPEFINKFKLNLTSV